MPFNLDIPYQAPYMTFQGLSNLGAGIGQGLEKLQQEQQLNQYQHAKNTGNYQFLSQLKDSNGNPYITPEMALEYQKGSLKQRQGIVESASANLATDLAMRQQDMMARVHTASMVQNLASAGLHQAQTNILNNPPPPPPTSNQPIILGGKEVGRYDNRGTPHFYPAQAVNTEDGPIPLDPVIDPNTGRRVAGRAINRKTGAEVDTSGENPSVVTLDPTGRFYLNNKTKSWTPIPQAQLMDMQMQNAPAPTPKPGLLQGIFGGGSAPTSSTPPAAPTPTRTLAPQDQQALDWALAHPDDSRAAAIKSKLGIQ